MIKSFARFFSTHRLIVEQMQQEVVEAALLIDKQKHELNQLREANRFHQLANDSLRQEIEALEGILPGRLCGESWNLPGNETVQISTTFGKLRRARAALTPQPEEVA